MRFTLASFTAPPQNATLSVYPYGHVKCTPRRSCPVCLAPIKVEIAPPLLGKFQSLLLDNRDLEGLARCLPHNSDAGNDANEARSIRGDTATRRASCKASAALQAGITATGGGDANAFLDSPSGMSGTFSSDSTTTIAEEEVS